MRNHFKDIQEISYDEISLIMEVPIGTVKSRINRARLQLRLELKNIINKGVEYRMERYEFEDQISDYIENNLSLKKRKIFVEYLKNNQDAQELVDEIENNIKKLNNLPKIVTSPDFNDHVNTAIKDVGLNPEINKSSDKKSLFGLHTYKVVC